MNNTYYLYETSKMIVGFVMIILKSTKSVCYMQMLYIINNIERK